MKKLELPAGSDASCVRLRSWNTTSGSLGEVYSEAQMAQTLEALQFFSYRAVYAETRLPGEHWPADATSMALSIAAWDPVKRDVRPAFLTYVPRDATLAQLREHLAPLVNIAPDRVRVLRVLSYEVQLLDGGDRVLRSDLAVAEGATLHVEELDEKGESPLVTRFEAEMNRIEIRFNLIDTHEYSQTLTIDKRKTVAELKEIIAGVVRAPLTAMRSDAMGVSGEELECVILRGCVPHALRVGECAGEPVQAEEGNVCEGVPSAGAHPRSRRPGRRFQRLRPARRAPPPRRCVPAY